MRHARTLSAVAALIVVASGILAVAQQHELIGRWESQYSFVGDQPKFALKPDAVVIEFSSHTMSALNLMPVGPNGPAGKPEILSFEARDSARPKTLDYWLDPSKKTLTIYEIKNDELWLSIPRTGETCGRGQLPRPTTFATAEDNCIIVLVLKKAKTTNP